jgi:hypothetical protein
MSNPRSDSQNNHIGTARSAGPMSVARPPLDSNWRDWLRDPRSWLPRAFLVATGVYFFISFLQASHVWWYTTAYNVVGLQIERSPIILCARHPTWLAVDGTYQSGMLSLRMLPPSLIIAASPNFSTTFSSTSTSTPIATTLPLLTTVAAKLTVPVGDLATERCRLTFQELSNRLVQSTPNPPSTPISVPPPTKTSLSLPLPFALTTSAGLRFVNDEDIIYSPIVSMTYNSEASVKIEHSGFTPATGSADFNITQLSTGESVQSDVDTLNVHLEGQGWMLWRKFWEIILAPATGALAALAAVALQETRTREEARQKRAETERGKRTNSTNTATER